MKDIITFFSEYFIILCNLIHILSASQVLENFHLSIEASSPSPIFLYLFSFSPIYFHLLDSFSPI